jgi:hypothetical protein
MIPGFDPIGIDQQLTRLGDIDATQPPDQRTLAMRLFQWRRQCQ